MKSKNNLCCKPHLRNFGVHQNRQWNHVAIKENPAVAGTGGMSADVFATTQLGQRSTFLYSLRFPFEPNKDIINKIKLGVNQAVSIEDTTSLAKSL